MHAATHCPQAAAGAWLRHCADEGLEPRDPSIDHGVVFLNVRDLLGRVRPDEPARPAQPIAEITVTDGAKPVELLPVLSELRSADGEVGRRDVGVTEGWDRCAAPDRARHWMS